MIWPFGRKKKKQSTVDEDQAMAAMNHPPERARTDPNQAIYEVTGRRPSRKDSSRRRRSSSRKLTKRNKDFDQADPLPDVPPIPPIPPIPPRSAKRNALDEKVNVPGAEPRAERDLEKSPDERQPVPLYYLQNPMSNSSLQPEKFSATPIQPTLRAKRSANDTNLSRRKSSKRKAEDHAREREVRAMSSPIPVPKRPGANAGGMLARDSKAVPGGLNRNFERPVSDVSVPLPESVHSAMSVAPDQHGFKVSAFDALSPRPTIRYSGNPRQNNGSGSLRPSRTSTRKEKQPAILEESAKSKKRIDELADDLDAGSLRELMERDRRRKENIRKLEQERLQRRLERKAEKQRAEDEAEVVAKADESDIGLGIAGPSTTRSKTNREEETNTPESWLQDPSRGRLPIDPFTDPVAGGSTTHLEEPTPPDENEPEEPVLETAKAVRLSSASMSPPASPSLPLQAPPNMSQLADLARRSTPSIPELAETERRDSDTSTRLAMSWTKIFRRSDTRAKRTSGDRGRAPSEFSNTSRDSLPRQMPPSAFPTRISQVRSGTPMRTQSRFRENLPEAPFSPPESRVQSPELPRDDNSPVPGQLPGIPVSHDQPLSEIHPAFREEIALSRHQSVRSAHSPDGPASAVLSESLASVDSEGSWLTGRPVKRLSQSQINPTRDSGGSLQKHLETLRGVPDNTGSVGGQEPTPAPEATLQYEPTAKRRHVLGAALDDESDDEDMLRSQTTSLPPEEGTWHSAVGRHPTIVRQGEWARSREGLLNDFQAAEESTETSPISPEEESPTGQALGSEVTFIHRATSVDVGQGHARHISAGSARLLNLPPRSSTELKRLSGSSGERSPLASSHPNPSYETHPSDVDD